MTSELSQHSVCFQKKNKNQNNKKNKAGGKKENLPVCFPMAAVTIGPFVAHSGKYLVEIRTKKKARRI
jgi:hypothetical protein